jgi:hypothetical protein
MSKVEIIVLKDAEGNYYALPREGVMQARVPDEYKDEIEKAIEGASGELGDSELEAVTGGTTLVQTITAPSSFTSFNDLSDTWLSG